MDAVYTIDKERERKFVKKTIRKRKLKRISKILICLLVVLVSTFLVSGSKTWKIFRENSKAVNEVNVKSANPSFTLQHYFYFNQIDIQNNSTTSSDNSTVSLLVIDTSNDGTGKGGILPKNGEEDSLKKYVNIKKGTNGRYDLVTHKVLVPLFDEEETDYRSNPSISYMDRLYNSQSDYNENYTLVEVWVLKEGKEKTSVKEDDFYVYKVPATTDGHHDPSAINFTNNPENPNITKLVNDAVPDQEEYTILISEDSVIRLVFNPVEEDNYEKAKSETKFFDYDISDGFVYSSRNTSDKHNTTEAEKDSTKTWYINTNKQGIHTDSNYSHVTDSEAHFAFGNTSGASGYQTDTWENNGHENNINVANKKVNSSTMGVYGLVKSFNEDCSINFADGIVGPDLFGPSTIPGKTTLTNFSMVYKRIGGTFTLSGIKKDGSLVLENLDTFKKQGSYNIYSNDFWPMDYADTWGADGHDFIFGSSAVGSHRHTFTSTLGANDDGLNHNPYFGIHFESYFTIDPGYSSPLDFFFFGDDDFWLFLTGPDGESKLIADIGGIHSSFGEYVNLWDYVEKNPYYDEDGNRNTESDVYKLSFYFTERGAGGSTLYMRYTLPLDSVTSADPTTKRIKIEKDVNSESDYSEYSFQIDFKNKKGAALLDIYDYQIYGEDDQPIEDKKGVVQTGDILKLEDGEYVIIEGIPDGTQYSVSEVNSGSPKTTYQKGTITNGLVEGTQTGSKVEGNIDTVNYIKFTNTYTSLTVKKEVIGLLGDKKKDFQFMVTVNNPSLNGKFGDMTFTSGIATFSLKDGNSMQAIGLPDGTEYTISEINLGDYAMSGENLQGTLVAGEKTEATAYNYLSSDLKVEKEVIGNASKDKQDFTFQLNIVDVTEENFPESYAYQKYTDDGQEVENGSGTIKNGETFTLKNKEYIIIKDISSEASFFLQEMDANASQTTYQTGTITDGLGESATNGTQISGQFANENYVKFTNTYASLTVEKIVTGNLGDKNKKFHFVVTLNNPDINGKFDDMTFTNGVATFDLKHGSSLTASGLPEGTEYKVEESSYDNYATYKQNDTGTLVLGENKVATFTNYVTKDLRIEKEVVGMLEDENRIFEFSLTLSNIDKEIYPKQYAYKKYNDKNEIIEEGTASTLSEMSLHNGEHLIIEGLPDEAKFTIKENDDTANKTVYYKGTIENDLGTKSTMDKVLEDDIISCNYIKYINGYTALRVHKTVIGASGDKNKLFNFTVTLDNKNINGKFADMTFTNGVAKFQLKHGETMTMIGLPDGTKYTVSEEAEEGYSTTMQGQEGTLVADQVLEANFFNSNSENGNIIIEKEVKGIAPATEKNYHFTLLLQEEGNVPHNNSYPYTIYNEKYEIVKSGQIQNGDTFDLKNKEYIIIEDIPETLQYSVTESPSKATTVSYYQGVMEKEAEKEYKEGTTVTGTVKENSYVKFINSYASLTVYKFILGSQKELTKSFTFTVTLSDKINGTYGDMEFVNGVATFTLKHGEKITATALPENVTYSVEETNSQGYKVKKEKEEGTLVSGEDQKVNFYNYLASDLKIEKEVKGDIPADREFTFDFELFHLNNENYPSTYTYQKYDCDNKKLEENTIPNGSSFTLKDGEYILIKDIPMDATFRVTEKATKVSKQTYVTGTILEGLQEEEASSNQVTGAISSTNYVKFLNAYSSLTIHKIVTGKAGETNKPFTFTVTLNDETINGIYGDMEFVNGIATFTLKHDESKKAIGLPDGIEYTVEEESLKEYTISKENETGVLNSEDTIEVTFTNQRETPTNVPNTLDNSNPILWGITLLGSILIIGCVIFFLIKKKKK